GLGDRQGHLEAPGPGGDAPVRCRSQVPARPAPREHEARRHQDRPQRDGVLTMTPDERFAEKMRARAEGRAPVIVTESALPKGNSPAAVEARFRAKLARHGKPEPKPDSKGEQAQQSKPQPEPKGDGKGKR